MTEDKKSYSVEAYIDKIGNAGRLVGTVLVGSLLFRALTKNENPHWEPINFVIQKDGLEIGEKNISWDKIEKAEITTVPDHTVCLSINFSGYENGRLYFENGDKDLEEVKQILTNHKISCSDKMGILK